MDYGKLLGLYGKLIAQCTDPLELQKIGKRRKKRFLRNGSKVYAPIPAETRGANIGALVIC